MMYVTKRELRLERILSRLDKDYANHYQELITKVKNKLDSVLADIDQMNLKSAKSSIIHISFEKEVSHFLNWASTYKWYRFHYFLGYSDIEKILLNRCTNVKRISDCDFELMITTSSNE